MTLTESEPAQADPSVELVQKRIQDQMQLIEKLRMEGANTQEAERLLATYHDLLRLLTADSSPG